MDIRRMNLENSTIKQVKVSGANKYLLGAERVAFVESKLKELSDREYWDAEFQAWLPMFSSYLSSGVNAELTSEYYGKLLAKHGYFEPSSNELSTVWSDVVKLERTSTGVLFEECTEEEMKQTLQKCKFYFTFKKEVVSQLYLEKNYTDCMEYLLKQENPQSLMNALFLYRHCQLPNFGWTEELLKTLHEKLAEWVQAFFETFDKVEVLMEDRTEVYGWYCQGVRLTLQRAWDTAMDLKDRIDVITNNDVYSLPVNITELLVRYINSLPCMYDNPFDSTTVWDALYQVFGETVTDAWEVRPLFALCAPKDYVTRMIEKAFDFYWIVQDDRLLPMLLRRKESEWEDNHSTEGVESYEQRLYARGFTTLKEGDGNDQ